MSELRVPPPAASPPSGEECLSGPEPSTSPAASAGAKPPRGAPAGHEPGAARLVATLALAGALAGALLVLVDQWTQPTIRAHKEEVLRLAVREVLGEPERFATLWVHDGALVDEAPEGASAGESERVYLGFDGRGRPAGYAIVAAEPGFQDKVELIFGYDPDARKLLGLMVLESKETPGLGDRIEKDPSFTSQFAGKVPPLQGIKGGAMGVQRGPGSVDMITGATISSRTVIRIVNHALERMTPLLEADARRRSS